MILLADDIKAVLWIAVVPAFIAVILIFAVREPDVSEHAGGKKPILTFADARHLPRRYWLVVSLGAVFSLARFSEAFLILRAQDVGVAVGYVPAILIVMNIVYSVFAYPAGLAADRFPSRTLLGFGLAALIAANVVLAMATSPLIAFFGTAFWGLHMALSQGLLSKLVADTSPAELRGTAFGIFNLISGVALLLASVIAGSLWNVLGASATFVAGACFATLAAAGLIIYRPNT